MNVTCDESGGRKRQKLNENSSFKNEVLHILLKVTDLVLTQLVISNVLLRRSHISQFDIIEQQNELRYAI